jgi:hypothetical protein
MDGLFERALSQLEADDLRARCVELHGHTILGIS